MRRLTYTLVLIATCALILSLTGCGDSSSSGSLGNSRIAYITIPDTATGTSGTAYSSRAHQPRHLGTVQPNVAIGSSSTLSSIKLDGTDAKTISSIQGYFDSPTMTTDFRTIVFYHYDPNTSVGKIAKAGIDGTGLTYLTDGTGSVQLPVITPKGDKVVYIDETGAPWQVYTMNLDGTNKQLLMNHPELCQHEVAVSPDGTKIVMNMHDKGTIDGTYVMNADGSNPVKISSDGSYWFGYPTFNNDGTKVLFTAYNETAGTDQIYSINLNGTGKTALTTDTTKNNGFPVVVGDKIVFMSDRSGGVQLFVMNQDGSGVKQITTGAGIKAFHGFYD